MLIRDSVVDFVNIWKTKTGFSEVFFIQQIGITRNRMIDWQKRYGNPNKHNGKIPKINQLEEWEKQAIIDYYITHPLDGYRRITYMMIDEDLVATTPATVYRVLKFSGVMRKWNCKTSKKGDGFNQPQLPHEHWHTDISYINICGTFYYLCSVLDGYSRYIVHWEIREQMTENDVEIVQQCALEKFPGNKTRLISDNGPQFISRGFKEFVRISGLTHVRISPNYPQSNGKLERFHSTYKTECIRPGTPLSLEDARHITADFIKCYNERRLHSSIGYVAPKTKLEGKETEVFAIRKQRLKEASERRKTKLAINE